MTSSVALLPVPIPIALLPVSVDRVIFRVLGPGSCITRRSLTITTSHRPTSGSGVFPIPNESLCMHLLIYKAVSEYIALAGCANGLWRRVYWKNGRVSTSFWLIRACPCAAFHIGRHVSVQFVTYTFPYDLSGAEMFPRKCLVYRHVHSQVRTLKRRISTHFWLTRTCLSTAWHLLPHYFHWCERNMGRVHSKRRYVDVSVCINVTWPTCLHARCLTKYVLTHKFSPLTWFHCCWDQIRNLHRICNLCSFDLSERPIEFEFECTF